MSTILIALPCAPSFFRITLPEIGRATTLYQRKLLPFRVFILWKKVSVYFISFYFASRNYDCADEGSLELTLQSLLTVVTSKPMLTLLESITNMKLNKMLKNGKNTDSSMHPKLYNIFDNAGFHFFNLSH